MKRLIVWVAAILLLPGCSGREIPIATTEPATVVSDNPTSEPSDPMQSSHRTDRPTSADVSATVTTSPQVQSINVQPTDLTASAHTSSQTQMTSQTVHVPEPLYSRPLYSEPSLASTISDEPVTAETTTGGTVPGTSAVVTASTAPTIAEELVMYQYPFDMDAIRKDLIAYGHSLGMTHRDTNPDGTLRTPANCQWWTPERLSAANIDPAKNRQRLYERVKFDKEDNNLRNFTIYIEAAASGGYNIYVLY